MNVRDFEEQFHELHAVYSRKSNEMGEQLKAQYERERKERSEQIDEELFDEIGKLFKTMDFDDKVHFLEIYTGRDRLAKYLEPHELTALRLIDWPYLVYLNRGLQK